MKKYIGLVIFLFFCVSDIVFAAECTYETKASLSKEALSVSSSYSIETLGDGTQYFKISVYNITSNLYIVYDDEYGNSHYITSSNSTNGVYSFDDFNTSSIFKYIFEVRSNSDTTGCSYKIISVYLIRPKKNPYSSLEACQYVKMKDYHYCQEWLTTDFLVDEKTILKNINEKLSATSTTSVVSSDDNEKEYLTFKELYIMIRIYLIIGFAVGIVIDAVCLYMSFKKVRESTL